MINEDETTSGYILLFRELHNDQIEKSIQLKLLSGKTIRIINLENGKSNVQKVTVNGTINFKIEAPGSFHFLKYNISE